MTRLLSITPEQIESVRNRQKADEAFRGTFGPNRGLQAHYDRAALLRALDEAQSRVKSLEVALEFEEARALAALAKPEK